MKIDSLTNPSRRSALTVGGIIAATGAVLTAPEIVNAEPTPQPPTPVDPVDPEVTSGETVIEEYPLSEVRTSGSVRRVTDILATMCGCTWNGTPVPDSIRLRWQNEDGSWGPWTDLEQAYNPETGEASEGTEPVWLGSAQAVEITAVRKGQDVTHELTAHIVTTSPRKQDVQIGKSQIVAGSVTGGMGVMHGVAPAIASMSALSIGPNAPDIVSRAQWGANEKLVSGVSSASELKSIIIHHTEGSNTYTQAEAPQQVRGILSYHAQSLGWADIGYNFLVDRFGTIYEARHGGIDKNIVGAHARGFNTGTCGISVMGSYMSSAPTQAAMTAVAKIAAWKLLGTMTTDVYSKANFNVTVDNVNFKKGTTVSLPRFFGHRDVNSTDCPGNAFYAKLNDVRSDIQSRIKVGYQGHLTAFNNAGGRDKLGTVTSIAHPVGPYVVTIATKGLVISDGQSNPVGYATPFASAWVSAWGRPAGNATTSGTTVTQKFQNGTVKKVGSGSAVFTKGVNSTPVEEKPVEKPDNNEATFVVTGAINAKWLANGGEKTLGAPKSNEYGVANGGRQQEFEKCHITYSPATQARITKGVMDSKWVSMGGSASSLKLPTSDAYTVITGITRQDFQNGSLMYNASTGVQLLHGAIAGRMKETAVVKSIGAPLGAEFSIKGGVQQKFQKGMITWSSKTGAHLTRGGIQSLWVKNGGATGKIGFPKTDEISTVTGVRQEFQNATFTWNRLTGKTTFTMK